MGLPIGALSDSLNQPLSVHLKDGRTLTGTLKGFDDIMNLTLEDATERFEGGERRLGTLVVRGSSLVSIGWD